MDRKLAELRAKMHALTEVAKKAARTMTADEEKEFDELYAQAMDIKAKIDAAKSDEARMGQLAALGGGDDDDDDDGGEGDGEPKARSLGEHFAKTVGREFIATKGRSGAVVLSPEFVKAPPAGTGDTLHAVWDPYLTTFEQGIQRQIRTRLTIEDLLGTGQMAGQTVHYLVENPAMFGGNFSEVPEGEQKPKLTFLPPDARSESLKKIAGYFENTDEMIEDLPFWVSEINNRGIYEFNKRVEQRLLFGTGTGNEWTGILNVSGRQTETYPATATGEEKAEAIFRAMTKVGTGADLSPDGVVINPLDYQAIRLAKDANDQYYGGGFFQGQYGAGTIMDNPPIWGLRTVVTPAITAGRILVGAFRESASVYTKGGLRVETTNSHASNFTINIVTTRIEGRKVLVIRRPAGFVDITQAV